MFSNRAASAIMPGGVFRLQAIPMQRSMTLHRTLLTLRLMLLMVAGAIVMGATLLPWVEDPAHSRRFRPDHRAEVLGAMLGACLHNYLLRRRRSDFES